ncbi:MAG: Smr/MutS family protein [Desulfarculaceae bacterium]|nr:Smr/MutS family protein [Desulfarculaceae bacterium]MCF8071094.1 Smr/MutS family protein [Desulfarculaceae bacterium]MCF8100682.1 Smr/MutS family protein [Desulfarculaceae bacterium]MCF8118080.1 Smr/MutS family protein [Desulfarculaceae bacterium]
MNSSTGRSEAGAGAEPCADAQTLVVLELGPLLERVASLAVSPLGAERARALRPCPDRAVVERRQRRLSQLRELMEEQGRPTLDGLADVRPLLGRLGPQGAFLVPEELEVMADFLGAAGRAASFLAPSDGVHDELFRLANQITPMPELAKELRRIIGPGHSVSSAASPELGRLRREAGRARESLRAQLMGLVGDSSLGTAFSDQVVTQRGGRFVVPVKADAKGRVAGIIHDTSGSGATCFVEPLDAVEGNNQLALLGAKEREEEIRVLQRVAWQLAEQSQALGENVAALAKLDCLLAQARLAERLDCHQPRLTEGEVELIRARHPLLAWRASMGKGACVPIDLRLDPDTRVLVISGANAGGKTATLKTLGLVTLMTLCGMHPPLDRGSRVALYSWVAAEVGDDQDLDRDLSTFTAHAGRLAGMVKRAKPGALFLIDEVGNGTDPGEGSALATAVLDWLAAHGATVLATTHYHRLKAYANLHSHAQNVSVAFDRATGAPTFQLHYGAPGFSDALGVAARLGFPESIIAAAEADLDQAERQTVALLREAEATRQQARQERAQASAERLAAQSERNEAKRLKRQAAQERAGALAEGKRRVREVAARMEKQLAEVLEQSRQEKEQGKPVKPGAVRQEVYAARREALSQVEKAAGDPEAPPSPSAEAKPQGLKEGDAVRLARLGQQGVLLEAPSEGREAVPVSVGVAGVRVMVPLSELEPLPDGAHTQPAAKPRPAQGVAVQASGGDGLELKLIGKTVEDALPLVDKALDQALVAGRREVKLVHGVGTGRLRAGVRAYLERHPAVASFRAGVRGEGGAGVTVAELRD